MERDRHVLAADEQIRQGDRYYFESTPELDLRVIRSDIRRTPSQVELMRSMLPSEGRDRIVFFREISPGGTGAPAARMARPTRRIRHEHGASMTDKELRGVREPRHVHRIGPNRPILCTAPGRHLRAV